MKCNWDPLPGPSWPLGVPSGEKRTADAAGGWRHLLSVAQATNRQVWGARSRGLTATEVAVMCP